MRELERRSGCTIGTIQTELSKLYRLGLVRRRRDGNRLYYRASRGHPIYLEIRGLVTKTVGVVGLLRESIGDLGDVEFAFIFGSFARGEETAGSDVDLMILGSIKLEEVVWGPCRGVWKDWPGDQSPRHDGRGVFETEKRGRAFCFRAGWLTQDSDQGAHR